MLNVVIIITLIFIRNNYFGTAVSGLSNQSFFELQLFPNPSTEQITIQSNGLVGEIGKIVNLSGQTILTFPLESTSIVIDIHQLNNGVYFVLIGTQSIKFIKQ
jgi:Secretion system C-terminal sorting domain